MEEEVKWYTTQLSGAIWGLVVGDALGVPVEFKSREYLEQYPLQEMTGYGTHNQPPGTWSDDSSLTFCLMESLCLGYNLSDVGQRFVRWLYEDYWTPHGKVFDVGIGTSQAIARFRSSQDPHISGNTTESSNGNGSLMRILPLLFYISQLARDERFKKIGEVSALTHAHPRSQLACVLYLEYIRYLLAGKTKEEAYQEFRKDLPSQLLEFPALDRERRQFHLLLEEDIRQRDWSEISGSGYVVDSLEASLWCFLKKDSYEACVKAAIHLGEDTDTTAAITGGLAGLYYGVAAIPPSWKRSLARPGDIEDLIRRFEQALRRAGV